jgi:hypothetical protein
MLTKAVGCTRGLWVGLVDAARLGRQLRTEQRQVAVAGGQAQGLWAR